MFPETRRGKENPVSGNETRRLDFPERMPEVAELAVLSPTRDLLAADLSVLG